MDRIALLNTLVLGLFILIGSLISLLLKKNKHIIDLSIGLAFGIITMLIITDIIPEIIESISLSIIYIPIIFTVIGFFLLELLDKFIPDHNESGKDNLTHIGIISALALGIHNIIEGMAVYSTVLVDPSLGKMLLLGVGCHNLPLGIVIGSTLFTSNKNKYKSILLILLISLTTFIGGLIMYFANIVEVSPIVEGILLSITLGMLIFIDIDELIPRIKRSLKTKNKLYTIIGILIGITILGISLLIGE